MDRRLKLDEELREILQDNLGYVNIYFQPPDQAKIKYDCIIYHRSRYGTRNADDKKYMIYDQYDVTFITRNTESPIPRKILEHFQLISPGRQLVIDNLYHFQFTLYY